MPSGVLLAIVSVVNSIAHGPMAIGQYYLLPWLFPVTLLKPWFNYGCPKCRAMRRCLCDDGDVMIDDCDATVDDGDGTVDDGDWTVDDGDVTMAM